jgi:hypothetical protein
MKSFILCLLPGLEEETGEYFETVCFVFLAYGIVFNRISGARFAR